MGKIGVMKWVCVTMLGCSQAFAIYGQGRDATLNDFFKFDLINRATRPDGAIAVSPDSKFLIYGQLRKLGDGHTPADVYQAYPGWLHREVAQDLWVLPLEGGAPRNITNGARDGATFWAPSWSPDGNELILLSSRGGVQRPWIWDRRSGSLTLLYRGLTYSNQPPEWVSNHEVIVAVPLKGYEPLSSFHPVTGSSQIEADRGSDPEDSIDKARTTVLESGVTEDMSADDTELRIVDTITGTSRHIAATRCNTPFSIYPPFFWLSPDKRRIALVRQLGDKPIDPNRTLDEENAGDGLYEIEVVDIATPNRVKVVRGLPAPIVVGQSTNLLWSPDSSRFVIKYFEIYIQERKHVAVCNGDTSACTTLGEKGADALNTDQFGQYLWYGNHDLLIRVNPQGRQEENRNGEGLWVKLADDGSLAPFGARLNALPSNLIVLPDGSGFVGSMNSVIWRLSLDGRQETRLASIPQGAIGQIRSVSQNFLTFDVKGGSGADLLALDLHSGKISGFERDSSSVKLLTISPDGKTGIFVDKVWSTHYASRLWSALPGQREVSTQVSRNGFAAEIKPFKAQKFDYRTADDIAVQGCYLLPQGFVEGKRYPVVVKVYPGERDACGPNFANDFGGAIRPATEEEPQMLAAHGYVVLEPSVPNTVEKLGTPEQERAASDHDKYTALGNGVMPAIDRLVELGIADPDRIGVMGHSDGGYSAYALITQTHRFKAAVAESGYDDLLSNYGTFEADMRYVSGTEIRSNAQLIEISVGEVPPWKDLWHYVRNSPIAYVDRVQTPVMIIHGDVDPTVPVEQGEEFFTAMQRQNKRAEFVVYGGEGHAISSPTNIYDMWKRIYAWFDVYLKPNEVTGSSSNRPSGGNR